VPLPGQSKAGCPPGTASEAPSPSDFEKSFYHVLMISAGEVSVAEKSVNPGGKNFSALAIRPLKTTASTKHFGEDAPGRGGFEPRIGEKIRRRRPA